jgi:hypothetical protein
MAVEIKARMHIKARQAVISDKQPKDKPIGIST